MWWHKHCVAQFLCNAHATSPAKVGVLQASHKISDSKLRICWHDASKFSSISSWLFDFLLCFKVFANNVSAFAENVSVYFLGGHGYNLDSSTSFTALLASNLLAQFSRQKIIQILGLESPKVCGNLAVRPLYHWALP
jgi:hypothetical protein